MTNHTYTVADFEQARFAEHRTLGLATRDTGSRSLPWQDAGGDQWSDPQMLTLGWEPVVTGDDEKDELIHLLRGTVRDIRDKATTLLYANKALHEDVAAAKGAGVSLEALRTAYEQAEEADECRKGDVLIGKGSNGYWVDPARTEERLNTRTVRILSRAPQREPWADLADVVSRSIKEDYVSNSEPEALARILHERGVRVTDGEES